jgi:hypothetical protein
MRQDVSNLPPGDQAWWQNYHAKLEQLARDVAGRGD